jgi:hypothetical protein
MPARYRISDTLKVPLKVRFDVNTTVNSNNEEVVSVGAENNVAGENISDTTSHSLQGVLDRAKATFPFELKLVPEAMTVYGYLTRAGMDQEDIVYLLNQPLVAKYLNMQKMNNSSINNALFGSKKDFEIKNKIILDVLNSQLNEDQIKKLIADVSNDKLSSTLKSLPEDLKITVTIGKNTENTTVKDLRNSLNTKKISPNLISGIRSADEESTKIYNRILGANWLSHKENLYFLIEKLAKVNLTNKDKITKADLYSVLNSQDASSSKALLIFLHYLELENQYSRMSDFEQAFSPDTSKLTTVQEAKDRKNVLKTFEKDEEIDQDFVKYMTKQSVISSLMFDDLTIDLVTPLFEIKLNEKITSFLKRGIDNTRAEIILKYGKGADGRANFTRAFGNNLINYIYQNYQTNFYDESGKLSNLPQSIDKKTIEINNDINTPVLIQEDKIIVNTRLIEFDYATKNYLENRNPETSYEGRGYDTFKLGQDPFISLRSFYRYNIERAILESKNSIDTLSNDDYFISLVAKNDGNAENAYKQYISERALLNSYNPMYIMGKTKYSYRDNILELLNSLENYPALFEKFTILSQISPQRNRDGYKIIRLNNRNDIKGALAQEYFNQIRQLGDYSIQKLDNPKNDPLIASKDKRISDLFNVFSLMMYYQHGIGKTTTGFVKGLDSTQYKSLMQDITPAFMSNYIETNEKFNNLYVSDLVLATIFNKTLEASNFNIFASPRNIYYNSDMEQIATQVDIELQKAGEEEFDINEGKQSIPEEFKRGDRLILDEDVKLYNSVLIKNNGVKPKRWTTPNTKFSEFYNGRQQGMPNSTAWLLNDNNLYDMVEIGADSDMAGTVYYENVDLETGYQMFKEGESPTQPTTAPVATTNNPAEFTNHSGGAYGGDTFWDIIGREFGVTNHMHYKDAGNTNLSQKLRNAGVKATVLTEEQMDFARQKVKELLGIDYSIKSTDTEKQILQKNLQVRNFYQVYNADAVFAVAKLNSEDNGVKGGTNTAVQLGIKLDKPVYVWDINSEQWYVFDKNAETLSGESNPSFVEYYATDNEGRVLDSNIPTLTKNFAGVGSRDIENYNVQKDGKWQPREEYIGKEKEESAKQAIRDVYKNTFKATTQQQGSVKEGVSELFESNPELAAIGTPEQYSQYLNTVFPDSKVKDIVYHGTHTKFNKFDKSLSGSKTKASINGKGFFFSNSLAVAQGYRQSLEQSNIYNDVIFYYYFKRDLGNKNIKDVTKEEWQDIVLNYFGSDDLNIQYLQNQSLDKTKQLFEKFKNDKQFDQVQYSDELDFSKYLKDDSVVYSVILNAVNPLVVEGNNYQMLSIVKKEIEKLKEDNDSIVFNNVEDGISGGYRGVANTYTVFEPEQIHILGGKQDIEGFKEFVSTQPTEPVVEVGSESSINTDMEEYQKLVEAANGVQPKTFTVGTRTWTLNKFGNYDWSDPTTNQIYMRNVDMETGKSVPEPLREEPVNPKLIEANLNWINTNKKLLDLDNKLAFLGYDINDVIDKLVSAKTMGDYYDVQEIFNKLC